MEFKGKTVAVLAISSVIVGALLGNCFGPRPRGNHIRLEIENGTNRVVLVPKKRDVIEWYTQPTTSHPTTEAYVKFQQWSPCQEGLVSTPTCTSTTKDTMSTSVTAQSVAIPGSIREAPCS
jgi:hypothetical protein